MSGFVAHEDAEGDRRISVVIIWFFAVSCG
jgi:hypothetical protein